MRYGIHRYTRNAELSSDVCMSGAAKHIVPLKLEQSTIGTTQAVSFAPKTTQAVATMAVAALLEKKMLKMQTFKLESMTGVDGGAAVVVSRGVEVVFATPV